MVTFETNNNINITATQPHFMIEPIKGVLNSHNIVILLRDSGFQSTLYWEQLGVNLNVPIDKINCLRQRVNHGTSNPWEALEEILDWWIRNSDQCNRSWEYLLGKIKVIDKKSFQCARKCLGKDTKSREIATILPVSFMFLAGACLSVTKRMFNLVFYIVSEMVSTTSVICSKLKGKLDGTVERGNTHVSNEHFFEKVPGIEERIWISGESGEDVVEKCIEKLGILREEGIFTDDNDLMRRLAFVMSRNGEALYQLEIDGGIWQVSKHALMKIKEERMHLQRKCERIQKSLKMKEWRKVTNIDLEKPMISAIAARLYISLVPEPIPPSCEVEQQQDWWWKYYMEKHEDKKCLNENDFKNSIIFLK